MEPIAPLEVVKQNYERTMKALSDQVLQGRVDAVPSLLDLSKRYQELFCGPQTPADVMERIEALETSWEAMRNELTNLQKRIELEKVAKPR